MVSVIIPTFNRAGTVGEAVKSVLQQSYSDLEVIVIDDCSSDNTESIIKEISDKRIRYIKRNTNQGACAARNMGIVNSSGEVIAFHDSDDMWLPNKLELQMLVLKDKKADVIFSAINRCNYGKKPEKFPDMENGFKTQKEIAMGFYVCTPTIVGKREVFEKFMFDIEIPRMQDYDLMVRISGMYKVYYMNDVLVNVYLQDNSITSVGCKYRQIEEISRIFLDKYPYLAKNYSEWEIEMLKRIAHSATMQGKRSSSIYREIYRKDRNSKNFLFEVLSSLGVLKYLFAIKDR